jgi:hypothetical protein
MAEAATLFDAAPDRTVMRQCTACGESKPLATAYRKRRGGYRKECRTCQYAKEKEWREAQGPQYRRATTQWELYRLSWDDYLEMLEKQGGKCAICRGAFSDDPRLIHTDHDHGCEHPGKGRKCCRECVRGILCHRCNIFVGWIENDYRRIGDVFSYLGVDGVVMWAHIMRDIGYEALRDGEREFARRSGDRDG